MIDWQLTKSKCGNEYLLTMLALATKYPEAIPLCSIKVKSIVAQLVLFLGRPPVYHPVRQWIKLYIKSLSAGYGRVADRWQPRSIRLLTIHNRRALLNGFMAHWNLWFETFVEAPLKELDEVVPFLLFPIQSLYLLVLTPFKLIFGLQVRGHFPAIINVISYTCLWLLHSKYQSICRPLKRLMMDALKI